MITSSPQLKSQKYLAMTYLWPSLSTSLPYSTLGPCSQFRTSGTWYNPFRDSLNQWVPSMKGFPLHRNSLNQGIPSPEEFPQQRSFLHRGIPLIQGIPSSNRASLNQRMFIDQLRVPKGSHHKQNFILKRFAKFLLHVLESRMDKVSLCGDLIAQKQQIVPWQETESMA